MISDADRPEDDKFESSFENSNVTFEQQFELIKLKAQLQDLSKEQLIQASLEFAKKVFEAQNTSKELLKEKIGLNFRDYF